MKSKWGKRIGYGIGDLGCNPVFSTMSSHLLIFYTDVFGIAAAAAGTMMLVTKLIDAVTDTVMGMVVDKTHTKWGAGTALLRHRRCSFCSIHRPDLHRTGSERGRQAGLGLCDLLPAVYRLHSGKYPAEHHCSKADLGHP